MSFSFEATYQKMNTWNTRSLWDGVGVGWGGGGGGGGVIVHYNVIYH